MFRRAKSYSDFYRAVQSQLEKDALQLEKGKMPATGVKTEVQLKEWLAQLEDGLLEAAHGDYQLVPRDAPLKAFDNRKNCCF